MELEIIMHSDISREDLLRVIAIKNAAWPHPLESQIKWIEEHQRPDDLHVILREGASDYAYMDLCPVTANIDGQDVAFMGVGNVCSKTKGQGHGGMLISLVNEHLKENNLKGLLFCKKHVVGFYAHYSWEVIPSHSIRIDENTCNVFAMTYNTPTFHKMSYNDRPF